MISPPTNMFNASNFPNMVNMLDNILHRGINATGHMISIKIDHHKAPIPGNHSEHIVRNIPGRIA